jgi:hypothetical protein
LKRAKDTIVFKTPLIGMMGHFMRGLGNSGQNGLWKWKWIDGLFPFQLSLSSHRPGNFYFHSFSG